MRHPILAAFVATVFSVIPLRFLSAQLEMEDDLPELTRIAEALKAAEDRIEAVTVRCRCTTKHIFCEPGKKLPPQLRLEDDAVASKHLADAYWILRSDGSGRLESVIDITNIRFDGGQRKMKRSFLSLFDAPRGRGKHLSLTQLPVDAQHLEDQTRRTSGFVVSQSSPTAFMSAFQQGRSDSEAITSLNMTVVRRDVVEDREVIVLQSEIPDDDAPNSQSYFEFWVDLERQTIVQRKSYGRRRIGQPWSLQAQMIAMEHAYFEPGVWLPRFAHSWSWVETEEGHRYCSHESHYAYSHWKINPPLDDELFSLDASLIELVGLEVE